MPTDDGRVGDLIVEYASDGTPTATRAVYANPDGVLSLRPWRETPEEAQRAYGIDPECAARWPGAHSFGYDPRCCRFPKSCSATLVEEITDAPQA